MFIHEQSALVKCWLLISLNFFNFSLYNNASKAS